MFFFLCLVVLMSDEWFSLTFENVNAFTITFCLGLRV